jgi:transposase
LETASREPLDVQKRSLSIGSGTGCNVALRRLHYRLARITRFSKLKRWGMDVAKRRGSKRAKVALARKIAVILHRMWVDGTTYRWTDTQPVAVQV